VLNSRERRELEERLASLTEEERLRLTRRAAKLRIAASAPSRRAPAARGAGERDEAGIEKLAAQRSRSLEEWLLRLLRHEYARPGDRCDAAVSPIRVGQVEWIGPGRCGVVADGISVACQLPPELAAQQQTAVAVGDCVSFGPSRDSGMVVVQVLPRRTSLSRPDPEYGHIERVVAANVDAVVIVVSVGAPPLHPRMIDRYLVAVERGGAQALICANKWDLVRGTCAEAEALAKLRPYSQIGIEVVSCSAAEAQGLDRLQGALAGKLCVFVGHSGVGKSSLLNALRPDLGLATNTLRAGDGKGRHTTTASHLYELPRGIRVIDTPGVRAFGLWRMSPEDVRWYFPEFAQLAGGCRFADCTHTHEPECGVKQGLRDGRVSRSRYDSYRRMLESL